MSLHVWLVDHDLQDLWGTGCTTHKTILLPLSSLALQRRLLTSWQYPSTQQG